MTDDERSALTTHMRLQLMQRSRELMEEQRGKHQVRDVLPLLWISLADVAGRNIAVGRNIGAVPEAGEALVTAIACSILGHGVREGQRKMQAFSFDWKALLAGTTDG